MTKLKYCKNCILPSTRPNLHINEEGNCSGCASKEVKVDINWADRKKQFEELINKTKSKAKTYDCLIPVSGGKDSTWQVIKALEYGLRPLCVTWKTPARNKLGNSNLENLIKLGVNHIDFSVNPEVEKKFTLKSFQSVGSPVVPMHMALHAIPLQLAIGFEIPLIIWGENSAFEYGGEEEVLKGFSLTHQWLKKYGVTNGTISSDWYDDNLNPKNMAVYHWPKDIELQAKNISTIFLGNYFEWDPLKTYNISKKYGFKNDKKPQTGIYNFADIDDSFLISVHHWLKWYKFGITRAWDNLSIEIRNNRMSRKKAIEIVNKIGEEKPLKQIKKFINYIEINENNFYKLCDQFRNKKIWKMNKNGSWKIKKKLK